MTIIAQSEVKMQNEFYQFDVRECMADSPVFATNYFRSDPAKKGFIQLLRKCNNYHLMIPPMLEDQIDDILTGKFAQVLFGSTMTTIVFDDLSSCPMVLNFDNQQILGMFDDLQDKPRRKGYLAIYILGDQRPDEIADQVIEVGRMDLWVNRQLGSKIRMLSKEELKSYGEQTE